MRDSLLMQRQCIAENSHSRRNLFTKLSVSAIICVKEPDCPELPVKLYQHDTVCLCETRGEQYE